MLRVIAKRRSVRKYQDREVEKAKLLQILESARLAPSGHNGQPWKFLIIEDRKTKEELAEVDHNQEWMLEAPVFIVGVAEVADRFKDQNGRPADAVRWEAELKKAIRDTAIAMEHMVLEAENQGLATCWTGWFDQKDVKRILGIPDDRYICGILTLGYAAETPAQKPRKTMKEIVRYGKWED